MIEANTGSALADTDDQAAIWRNNVAACAPTPLTTGVWSYVEVSYIPPTITLRKDGARGDRRHRQRRARRDDWNAQIGTSGFNEHFSGEIENVRIYNCGISLAQHVSDMDTSIGAMVSTVAIKTGAATKKIGPSITEKFGLAQ